MIYGTHNSTSRRILKSDNEHLTSLEIFLKTISPVFWESMVICQDKTITQQIEGGVGALDIRIAEYNGELVVTHTDIVGVYDDVVEDITQAVAPVEKPIIFLVLDWEYHESVEFDKRAEVLREAKKRLTDKGYPGEKLYLGTSWANIWPGAKSVVSDYRGTTFIREHSIQSYQNDIDAAKAHEISVIFTQLTTDSYILGIEFVMRFVIPILSIIIMSILYKRNMIHPRYMILMWIPVSFIILQYYMPGLVNTPETLNKHRRDYIKDNLTANKEGHDVIVMLDFF